ncbi:dirigent protein 21-like [Salvia miltiorrhiza]|uniref:dirigent protein 21-like n=1 Tax=Salvia miltiorrhiza TaxID=226208 RepID=UPI0025AC9889|nr:dirigent protein 21-like [Salvia miltiorrhiza]
MARATTNLAIFSLIIFLSAAPIINSQEFSRKFSKREMGMKREKLSHLHFYFHDVLGGRNPTAVRVAQAATTSSYPYKFGEVLIIDDRLTVGPNLSSKVVGRAQGMYASADVSDAGLLMVFNFAFVEGRFNGSTLSVLGRNAVLSAAREMPIVGGSGVFRFARGYARTQTHLLDLKMGYAVEEYDVYVFHY